MASRAICLAVLTAACGRVAFDPRSDADPDAPDAAQDIGLIAHYTMDEVIDGALADVTGNGHHGSCTMQECPIVVVGIRDSALLFDGALSSIRVPSTPAFEQLTEYTISLWARLEQSPQTGRCAFTKVVGTDTGNTWEICVDPIGQVFFSTWDGTANDSINTTVALSTSWRHVTLRWDGTTESVYVDGAFVSEQVFAKPTDSGPVMIGSDLNNGAPYGWWWGALDDLRIYGRALSPIEIAALAVP